MTLYRVSKTVLTRRSHSVGDPIVITSQDGSATGSQILLNFSHSQNLAMHVKITFLHVPRIQIQKPNREIAQSHGIITSYQASAVFTRCICRLERPLRMITGDKDEAPFAICARFAMIDPSSCEKPRRKMCGKSAENSTNWCELVRYHLHSRVQPIFSEKHY